MVCLFSCSLAVAFIAASLFVMLNKSDKVDKLINVLSPEKKDIYENIRKERMTIYMYGLVAGLVAGLVMIWLLKDKIYGKLSLTCLFIVTVFIVQLVVYHFYPKSKWMLDYLDKPEEIQAWSAVYKQMKMNYHVGFIAGLVGYGLACYAFA
jgi:hypothetical protein